MAAAAEFSSNGIQPSFVAPVYTEDQLTFARFLTVHFWKPNTALVAVGPARVAVDDAFKFKYDHITNFFLSILAPFTPDEVRVLASPTNREFMKKYSQQEDNILKIMCDWQEPLPAIGDLYPHIEDPAPPVTAEERQIHRKKLWVGEFMQSVSFTQLVARSLTKSANAIHVASSPAKMELMSDLLYAFASSLTEEEMRFAERMIGTPIHEKMNEFAIRLNQKMMRIDHRVEAQYITKIIPYFFNPGQLTFSEEFCDNIRLGLPEEVRVQATNEWLRTFMISQWVANLLNLVSRTLSKPAEQLTPQENEILIQAQENLKALPESRRALSDQIASPWESCVSMHGVIERNRKALSQHPSQ
jgi:hypothetical protein